MTLTKTMKDIIPAYEEKNHKVFKECAHQLKGASAYIAASRLHYVCYYIQEFFLKKKYFRQETFYPNLVEAAIEFKIYSRNLIAKHNKKKYVPVPEDEETFHSK